MKSYFLGEFKATRFEFHDHFQAEKFASESDC